MRIISFLGTGDYQPTRYVWPETGGEYLSRYVTLALAALVQAREVVVLATEQAEAIHGQALEQAFAQANLHAPRLVRIAEGRSLAELWDNFNLLSELLQADPGEETLLDITHGFRSQPLFAGAVVAFVRAVANPTPCVRVVYGAFEARENDQTPIWELTAFVDLLDWTQAIELFLRSGQGQVLAEKAEQLGKELAKKWAKEKQGPPPQVKKFASALRAFSQALNMVRTGELLLARDKHPAVSEWLAQALVDAEPDIRAHIPPLALILEKIARWLEPLRLKQAHLAGPEGQRAMAALAEWYFQLGRYAEAAIILREGWVNLYATFEATCPGEHFDELGRRQAEQRLTHAGYQERELMGLRNDLEHGGFRKRPLSADAIRRQLARYLEEFKTASPPDATLRQELSARSGTVWFVSRHSGAVEWARRRDLKVDRQVAHLDPTEVQAGDMVIGTLPVNLAAKICKRGARYFHLALDLPPELRGKELDADEMERFGAELEEYLIQKVEQC